MICSCTIFGNELTVNADAGDSHVTRVLGLFVYSSNSGKLFMSKSLSQGFYSTSTSTSLNYMNRIQDPSHKYWIFSHPILCSLKTCLHVQFKISFSCLFTLSNMMWGCPWMPPHHLYSTMMVLGKKLYL